VPNNISICIELMYLNTSIQLFLNCAHRRTYYTDF